MSKLPVVSAQKAVRALKNAGFVEARQSGSHLALKREGHTVPVTVPMHSGDLKKGTLRGIITAAGLTVEDFIGLL